MDQAPNPPPTKLLFHLPNLLLKQIKAHLSAQVQSLNHPPIPQAQSQTQVMDQFKLLDRVPRLDQTPLKKMKLDPFPEQLLNQAQVRPQTLA